MMIVDLFVFKGPLNDNLWPRIVLTDANCRLQPPVLRSIALLTR